MCRACERELDRLEAEYQRGRREGLKRAAGDCDKQAGNWEQVGRDLKTGGKMDDAAYAFKRAALYRGQADRIRKLEP